MRRPHVYERSAPRAAPPISAPIPIYEGQIWRHRVNGSTVRVHELADPTHITCRRQDLTTFTASPAGLMRAYDAVSRSGDREIPEGVDVERNGMSDALAHMAVAVEFDQHAKARETRRLVTRLVDLTRKATLEPTIEQRTKAHHAERDLLNHLGLVVAS